MLQLHNVLHQRLQRPFEWHDGSCAPNKGMEKANKEIGYERDTRETHSPQGLLEKMFLSMFPRHPMDTTGLLLRIVGI